MLVSNSKTKNVLKKDKTTCTKVTAKNKCPPIFLFSFTFSCSLGLNTKIIIKNTKEVTKYTSKLLKPKLINVPIKDKTYIIPTGLSFPSAPAIMASPNGTKENI